jgi:very-short-patch-repair endonuclease
MGDISRLGEQTAGVWTREQVLRSTSPGRYDALVRSGDWQLPWPGVCADAGYDLDVVQRAFAGVLASGGQVLPVARSDAPDAPAAPEAPAGPRRLMAYACGRTAARVWGFPLVDDDDPATGARDHVHDDVGVWRNVGTLHHDGRTLHRRQLRLRPGDLVRHDSGLWLTSPLRTLADCAGLLSVEALVCCLDDALHRGLAQTADLDSLVDSRKGSRSITAFRAAVAAADGRAEAPSETLLRLVLRPHFPRLEPQVQLFDAVGRLVARYDLGDRKARVAVEADGRAGHEGMAAKDRRRDRASRRQDWLTERATWFDIRRRQRELVERVQETYDEQARRRPAA